jgi:YD repeat-containing protein
MTMRSHVLCLVLACALPAAADTVRYSYDDAGRLTKVEYGSGQSITYTYDGAGNLLARTVTVPGSGDPAPAAGKGKESKRENAGSAVSRQAKRTQRGR